MIARKTMDHSSPFRMIRQQGKVLLNLQRLSKIESLLVSLLIELRLMTFLLFYGFSDPSLNYFLWKNIVAMTYSLLKVENIYM